MDPTPESNPYAAPRANLDSDAQTPHDRFIAGEVAGLLAPGEQLRLTAYLIHAPSPWKQFMVFALPALIIVMLLIFVIPLESLEDLPVPLPVIAGALTAPIVLGFMALFVRPHLAAITNQRIVLFRTRHIGFKPHRVNLGVDEIRWSDVDRIVVGGIANNRSLEFVRRDGSSRTLRIGPWSKFVSGQRAFFEFARGYESGAVP